jgi:hypothetical protein
MRGSSGTRMSTHDSGVNNHAFHVDILDEVTMHPLPDTFVRPSHKSFVYGVPFAVLRRKESPLGARACDPQNGFNESPALRFVAHVDIRAVTKETENL